MKKWGFLMETAKGRLKEFAQEETFFDARKTILEAKISLTTLGCKGNVETERGELLHGRLFGPGRMLGVNSFSAPVGVAMV